MDKEPRTQLADAYLERYAKRYGWDNEGVLRENDLNAWVEEEVSRIAHNDPEGCWLLILDLVGRTSDEFVLMHVEAGPLENLISLHGPAFIDRIECEAQTNSAFRSLLHGVGEHASPELRRRLEVARAQNNARSGA